MEEELRRIVVRRRVLLQVLREQRELRPAADELRLRALPYQLTA